MGYPVYHLLQTILQRCHNPALTHIDICEELYTLYVNM